MIVTIRTSGNPQIAHRIGDEMTRKLVGGAIGLVADVARTSPGYLAPDRRPTALRVRLALLLDARVQGLGGGARSRSSSGGLDVLHRCHRLDLAGWSRPETPLGRRARRPWCTALLHLADLHHPVAGDRGEDMPLSGGGDPSPETQKNDDVGAPHPAMGVTPSSASSKPRSGSPIARRACSRRRRGTSRRPDPRGRKGDASEPCAPGQRAAARSTAVADRCA